MWIEREDRRAGHREERHRLGEPVDRRAPVLLEEQQNRRDQRAGVADADPPDEVDDVERPADRNVVAPDPDALGQQVGERDRQAHQKHERDARDDEPRERRVLRQDDRRQLVGDRPEAVPRRDDRQRRAKVVLCGYWEAFHKIHSVHSDLARVSAGSDSSPPPDTSCAAACRDPRAARSCAPAP